MDTENNQENTINTEGMSAEQIAEFTRMQERLKDVNEESAGRRIKVKELEAKISTMEAASLEALEKSGNHEELNKRLQSDVAELTLKAKQAEEYEAAFKSANEKLLEKVAEDKRGLVPEDYSPGKLNAYLLSNMDALTATPRPANLNGAAETGNNTTSVKPLTEAQTAAMKFSGLSEEDYRKAMR